MRGKALVKKKIYQFSTGYDVPSILFFAGFFLHELSVLIDASMWAYSADDAMTPLGFFAKIIRFTAYGLFLLKILYDCKIGSRNVYFIYATVGIIGLAFIGSRNPQVVFYLLIMIAALGISDRTLLLSAIISQGFMLLVTVGFSMAGVIENFVIADNKGRVREFLGFVWTTNAPIIFFFVTLQFIYLKKGRLNVINTGIILFFAYMLFVFTDSKAAFAVSFAAPLFFLLFGSLIEKGRVARAFKWLIIALPWILAAVTIMIHKMYNKHNALLFKLNVILSKRLEYGHNAIHKYGIHLFGQRMEWVGYSVGKTELTSDYNFVDCSYLNLLLEYGVLFLILLLTLYSVIIYKAYKSGKYYAVWIAVFILLFGTTEPRLFNLTYNPLILLAFASLDIKLNKT